MANRYRLFRVLSFGVLAALLVAGVLACGPSTATLKFTIKDPGGAVLAGATVTVQGAQPVKTDAQGKATVSEIQPGPVDVTVSAPGMHLARRETVKKGANEFAWQLEAEEFKPIAYSQLKSHLVKVTKADGTVILDGTQVIGTGARFVMGGKEVVSLADATYVRQAGGDWQTLGPMTQGIFWQHLQPVQTYLGRIDMVHQLLSAGDEVVTPQPRQEANGQECAVFDVKWEVSTRGQYRLHVVADGPAKGHVVRYQWNQPGVGDVTVDILDIGNPGLTVAAPN